MSDSLATGMSGSLLGAVSLGTAIGNSTTITITSSPTGTPGGGGGQVGCFAAGTMILTATGERAVEALVEDDILVTASGEHMSLLWVGRRTIRTGKASNRLQVLPIRIKAGAFAEGIPHRDLFVSPDHAMLLDGVLVPALKLINGGTIAQIEVDEVTYYHLECDHHVILVAEGAGAESYLEAGNRVFFVNAPDVVSLQPMLAVPDRRALLAAPWADREQISEIRRANLKRCEALGYLIRTDGAALEDALRPRRMA